MARIKGHSKTPARSLRSAAQVVFRELGGGAYARYISPSSHSAIGSGVIDDTAALVAMDTAAGHNVLTRGTYLVESVSTTASATEGDTVTLDIPGGLTTTSVEYFFEIGGIEFSIATVGSDPWEYAWEPEEGSYDVRARLSTGVVLGPVTLTVAAPDGTSSAVAVTVGDVLTISSHTIAEPGAILKPASGLTVVLNGFEGDLSQKFDLSLGGQVIVQNVPEVYPEWWGLLGDGVTDDTTALQAAANAGATLKLPAGEIVLSSTVDLSDGAKIVGSGRGNTIIRSDLPAATLANVFDVAQDDVVSDISATLSSVITKGDVSMAVSDGSQFEEGMLIQLHTSRQSTVDSSYTLGEWNEVSHVDTNTVYVRYPFYFGHDPTVDTISFKSVEKVQIDISDLTIEMTDAEHQGIGIYGAFGCRIQQVDVVGPGGGRQGISLTGAHNRINQCSVSGLLYAQHGYGVKVDGLDNVVSYCTFRHCRHPIASSSRTLASRGAVYTHNFAAGTADGTGGAEAENLNFHALAVEAEISFNRLYNCGIVVGSGDYSIIGNRIYGENRYGIRCEAGAFDTIPNLKISFNTIAMQNIATPAVDILSGIENGEIDNNRILSSGGDMGFSLAHSQAGAHSDLRIHDNFVNSDSYSLFINNAQGVHVYRETYVSSASCLRIGSGTNNTNDLLVEDCRFVAASAVAIAYVGDSMTVRVRNVEAESTGASLSTDSGVGNTIFESGIQPLGDDDLFVLEYSTRRVGLNRGIPSATLHVEISDDDAAGTSAARFGGDVVVSGRGTGLGDPSLQINNEDNTLNAQASYWAEEDGLQVDGGLMASGQVRGGTVRSEGNITARSGAALQLNNAANGSSALVTYWSSEDGVEVDGGIKATRFAITDTDKGATGLSGGGDTVVGGIITERGKPISGISALSMAVSNPPTQAEVQAIADKVDELIVALS